MRIVFFEIEKEEKREIKRSVKGHNLKFTEGCLTEKNAHLFKKADILVIFIHSIINKKIVDQLPNVKYIATRSRGYSHIDVSECKKRNIQLSNVPLYGNSVAEFTIGLIFALLRNIHKGISKTKKNNFDLEGLEGTNLQGKTIGVIGPGNIGQHVIKYGKAFEMNVLVYGRTKNKKIEKKYNCKYVSLNDLLKKSDIITLHVPLTKKTRHLIDLKNIKKIKRGSYLINTSRGDIIDTTALLYALDKGILKGAALDVLEGEENTKEEKHLRKRTLKRSELKVLKENNELLKKRNVIVTPHIAFYTKESLQRITDTTIENVSSFIKGRWINKAN